MREILMKTNLTPNTKFALPPPVTTHSRHMTPVSAQAKAYTADVMNERRRTSVSCNNSCRAVNIAKVWETWHRNEKMSVERRWIKHLGVGAPHGVQCEEGEQRSMGLPPKASDYRECQGQRWEMEDKKVYSALLVETSDV